MKLADLIQLIEKVGIYPSKKLGQNFLLDENLLDFITKIASPKKDEYIIEIGPGLGSLTERILASEAKLTAIEYDARLFAYLAGKYKNNGNITLINEDACKSNYTKISENWSDYRVISNLPYSISTPLIAKLGELERPPLSMVFLLQKETAMRFISKNKTKEYGSISARIQNIYDIELVRTVAPEVFYPMPEVNSAIVKFTRKAHIPDIKTRKKIDNIVKTAFLKRRKKLINTIAPLFNGNIKEVFEQMNLNPNARPEDLSPEDYLKLSSFLKY
ncbi:MAG: 16S rRNA (adenine(1518)-N(6)/adenine(1519)-N(6))-dimethyltransferase RsmA [Lentisphaerota bacterium]